MAVTLLKARLERLFIFSVKKRSVGIRAVRYSLAALIASLQLTNAANAADRATVFLVQMFLNNHGYNAGEPDGISGPNTRSALSAFAEDHTTDATFDAFVSYAKRTNISERKEISDPDLLAEAKEEVAAKLRNPDSAKFRNIFSISGPSFTEGSSTYVCGEVNGHNAYGGYSGFQWFFGTSITAPESGKKLFLLNSIDGPDEQFAQAVCTMTFAQ